MNHAETHDNPTQPLDERRTAGEPALSGADFATDPMEQFPELKSLTEGAPRARGAIQHIVRNYFTDPAIQARLHSKVARAPGMGGETAPAAGIPILAHSYAGIGGAPSQPATLDGRSIFQSYLDSKPTDPEAVKDILFAIRREARTLENAYTPKFQKLYDLASLAIFSLQQQRRIEHH